MLQTFKIRLENESRVGTLIPRNLIPVLKCSMTSPINDFIQKNIICWEFISKLGLFHLGVIAYEMPTLFSLQVFNSAYVLFLICRQKLKIIVLQTTLMLII